jgi:hypothetical protein
LQDFRFLVIDRRYSVPTLHFVQARDERRARELAKKLLEESQHHRGVEVWTDDILLFELGETDGAQELSA